MKYHDIIINMIQESIYKKGKLVFITDLTTGLIKKYYKNNFCQSDNINILPNSIGIILESNFNRFYNYNEVSLLIGNNIIYGIDSTKLKLL